MLLLQLKGLLPPLRVDLHPVHSLLVLVRTVGLFAGGSIFGHDWPRLSPAPGRLAGRARPLDGDNHSTIITPIPCCADVAPNVVSRSCQSGDVVGHKLRGVRWVVFDVGETLVNENRLWATIADQCGVPVATVCGVLGGLIERGEGHHRLWDVLGVARIEPRFRIERRDLYPDALDCIEVARRLGLGVGIAGNQPAELEDSMPAAGVRAEFIGTSAAWRVHKPDPEFFARIIDAAHVPAHTILYVGDRLDNDVLPANRAGMRTAHIRRGPWGFLHARHPEIAVADLQIDSLHDLAVSLSEAAAVEQKR